jgi:hypothetical protein
VGWREEPIELPHVEGAGSPLMLAVEARFPTSQMGGDKRPLFGNREPAHRSQGDAIGLARTVNIDDQTDGRLSQPTDLATATAKKIEASLR